LLYTYAANAKTLLLGGKTNLLESCFEGWIIHVWGQVAFGGLASHSPLSSPCEAEVQGIRKGYGDWDEVWSKVRVCCGVVCKARCKCGRRTSDCKCECQKGYTGPACTGLL